MVETVVCYKKKCNKKCKKMHYLTENEIFSYCIMDK